jgi:hypothetical protein
MKVSILIFILFSKMAWAGPKVAIVKLLRGNVLNYVDGKPVMLKADDWIPNGSIIKTTDKSFVKLIFTDKSQMNIGPNSLMKVENFTGKDSGVIDLVKGKIRSQVSKDYLQIDKNKSKLFIKTKNAVLGVRGTDFMISTNGKNTATVLFEGEIAFNKFDGAKNLSSDRLESIVDRGMRMFPGEFSVVERDRPQPTIPSLMNIQQRDALENNDGLNSRTPSNTREEVKHTVVPEGLDGKIVSNESQTLKNEVDQISAREEKTIPLSADPDGYIKGQLIKPANGSFVHMDSGVIIPPGPGSLLDKNSNTYIPGQEMGQVNADGSYIPPENVEITADGKVLVSVTDDSSGSVKVQEVQAPTPVQSNGGVSLANMSSILSENPSLINPATVVSNDVLGRFTPRGVLLDAGDQLRSGSISATQSSGGVSPTTTPGQTGPSTGLIISVGH